MNQAIIDHHSSIIFHQRVPIPTSLLTDIGGGPNSRIYAREDVSKKEIVFNAKTFSRAREVKVNASGHALVGADTLERMGVGNGVLVQFERNGESVTARFVDRKNVEDDHPLMTPNLVNGLAMPPGWLCQSFTSMPCPVQFYKTGRNTVSHLLRIAKEHGVDADAVKSVFDWGCGSGRVLGQMTDAFPNAKLHGCDLHAEAVAWANANYPHLEATVSQEMPPLKAYSDAQFDFLYAISVFTHLDEPTQDAWLGELQRISKPGALLVLTYRSDEFVRSVWPDNAARKTLLDALETGNGFAYQGHDLWEGVFPDYYADAYQTDDYIRSHWEQWFDVLSLVPSGSFANRQNAAVVRRRLD